MQDKVAVELGPWSGYHVLAQHLTRQQFLEAIYRINFPACSHDYGTGVPETGVRHSKSKEARPATGGLLPQSYNLGYNNSCYFPSMDCFNSWSIHTYLA